jgi:hypothetical protein
MFENNFGHAPRRPAGHGKIARLPGDIPEKGSHNMLIQSVSKAFKGFVKKIHLQHQRFPTLPKATQGCPSLAKPLPQGGGSYPLRKAAKST